MAGHPQDEPFSRKQGLMSNALQDRRASTTGDVDAACANSATEPARELFHPGGHDLIAIAASLGGIKALGEILSALPPTFPAAIVIVQHRAVSLPNYQAQVLGRHCSLPVKFASELEQIRPGTVYLASPDTHLTIRSDRTFALVDGRKIRFLRSSANPLFSSAAEVFGKRLIAMVLTGGDKDAVAGVQDVKTAGGMVIAQDPETCENADMPRAAIATGCVDLVLPVDKIAPALVRLVEVRHQDL
jgi:two-component system chemotaxis response regulator CheB